MSYDLMVFDPAAAPREREAFLAWFEDQSRWGEGHEYDDPSISSPALRQWFAEAIHAFPALNGPFARRAGDGHDEVADQDEDSEADYCIGRSLIYVAFVWSKARAAYDMVFSLAAKHGLGFYDVSSSMGEVWLPAGNGTLALQHLDEEAERHRRRRDALERWVATGAGDPRDWLGTRGDAEAEAEAAANVEKLEASLHRRGYLAGVRGSAAIWFRHALDCLVSVAEVEGLPSTPRAALLAWDKRAEGLRALPMGDEGLLLYPAPSGARAVGGDGHLLRGHEVVSPFVLTLGELTHALKRAGHGEPKAFAEALLASAATAVLCREAQFHEGDLVEFRTITDSVALHPHEISLEEARTLDESAQPGEELGFVSAWRAWLYPLLDWLYASERESARLALETSGGPG